MQSGTIFVWRVRLLLLAAAIGLIGLNAGKVHVPSPQPVQLRAQQPAMLPLMNLAQGDTPDFRITPAASFAVDKKPAMLKMVAGADAGPSCLDRPVSQPSNRKSPKAMLCETWGGTPSAIKITHAVSKHKLPVGGYPKKHLTMTASHKPGPGSLARLAKRSEPKPAWTTARSRNVSPAEQLSRWAATRELYGPDGPS